MADARAILDKALANPLSRFPLGDSNSWPDHRPMLRWLVHLLPDGGVHVPQRYSTDLLDRFFDSWAGVPFANGDCETLLECFLYQGNGDPLRWSAKRLSQLLKRPSYDEHLELDVQLNGAELLRAFVPFAHAESGIRHELTAQAVATIDALADGYQEAILESARQYEYDDDDEPAEPAGTV